MLVTRRAALAALLPTAAIAQQALPRQIRIVVGFAAGGANDIVARLLAAKLSERLPGTTVLVENRVGAGTLLAAEHVSRAAPDGGTLLFASSSTVITTLVNRAAKLELTRDFAAVSQVQSSPLLLVCRKDFQARTLADVLAMARAKPGELTMSNPGAAGINHLAAALLTSMTGAEFTIVPYLGNTPSLAALMRGDVDLAYDSTFATRSLLDAGSIRGLAISSAQPSPQFPGVPTFAATVPGYEVLFWGGLLAPRATPEPVLEQLNREIAAVMRLPEVEERMRGFGADAVGGTRAAYAKAIADDWVRWGKVVEDTGLRDA